MLVEKAENSIRVIIVNFGDRSESIAMSWLVVDVKVKSFPKKKHIDKDIQMIFGH